MKAQRALAGTIPVLALAGLASACGGEEALQLVQGTLSIQALQVRAFAPDANPTGSAPVLADGRFVLALPAGRHRLTVVVAASDSRPLGPPAGLEICAISEPLDLGAVRTAPEACPPLPECEDAHARLERCVTERQLRCEDLARQSEECRVLREEACRPFSDALEACMIQPGEPPDCLAEQEALDVCFQQMECTPIDDMYFAECVPPPCLPEQEALGPACAQDPACLAAGAMIPSYWPPTIACEAAL
ncbi:MAG: hypothetical protein H6730_06410 [Deltaproteobacteria bacterium]|nr:hypothetical protein [Deltaproteobacteria bacterium]